MLIIKGNVYTSKGPIPVEQLKEGDLLVDRGHRARRLLQIERHTAAKVLKFLRNAAILSADAVLLTSYGARSVVTVDGVKLAGDNVVSMTLPNYRVVQDKVMLSEEVVEGYKLTVENGENIFVDDYCVKL